MAQEQLCQGLKYVWQLPLGDERTVHGIALKYNLAVPVAQVLVSRGIISEEEIDAYLFSSLERDVPHPGLMKDALRAVERILQAIERKEKILICGDYDVDGITSSSLMLLCLMPLGAQINFFLPHRVKDGYGLSEKVIKRAAQNGYKLVITVDNGITAFDAATMAKKLNIDLVITDHHRPHDHVPDAFAIINPHQHDCAYPYKHLAGVGVTFKILALLYEKIGKPLPAKVYELLMLGTIADVVPLTGENRYWVRYGLQYVNKVESYAFKVLKQNGNVTKSLLNASDIGFSIAPQLNALGRLEDARDGVRFLIGSDQGNVNQVGKVLFELNQARKEIERGIYQEVVQQVERGTINLEHENIIIAASHSWPPGVIGLVASRVVGKYGRPTILFHATKDGLVKGSCRSIPGFNMFDALHDNKELLKSFGGHAMAAGLALSIDNLPELKRRLEKLILEKLKPEDLVQKLELDAEVTLSELNGKLVADMRHLEPFGNSNVEPTFYVREVTQVAQPTLMKDQHVKCQVFAGGVIKPLVFFNRPELFEPLLEMSNKSFDVAVKISENHWNGRVSVEMIGVDIKL